MRNFRIGALCASLFMLAGAAGADELRIGAATLTSSTDPHAATSFFNFSANVHIFDPLVRLNNDGGINPALAESWTLVDDTTWEFKLRQDVTWHDGSPFTAEDVVYTLERASGKFGGPTAYRTYTRPIAGTQVVDAHTVRISTNGPTPNLLDSLSYILVISKKQSENKATEDFNSGAAAVGTGPYKFVNFAPNERVELALNESYWGDVEPWEKVSIQAMPSAPARMAALVSGSIDVADLVPPQDLSALESNNRVKVWSRPSDMIVFVNFDAGKEAIDSGKVASIDGSPLTENPLGDKRVREALKMSLDLNAMVSRIYRGTMLPDGQYMREGRLGYANDIKPWAFDDAAARKLLEDAGWSNKFRLVLQTSTGATFPLATQLAEVIAQSWTRIGVPTTVETVPHPVFVQALMARGAPIHLTGYNNIWGTPENFYSTMLHSRTEDRRYGALNQGYYHNPKVDELISTGFADFNVETRGQKFAEATRIAVADNQMMPLFHVIPTVATSANIVYTPRTDGLVFSTNVKRAQ